MNKALLKTILAVLLLAGMTGYSLFQETKAPISWEP